MKLRTQAALLFFIFLGGFLCKTFVIAHSEIRLGSLHGVTWLQKNRQDSLPEIAYSKIFKSRRRIEKHNLASLFVVSSSVTLFFLVIKVFQQISTIEPSSLFSLSPIQPPQ